jgi:hypothetical protein
MLKHVIATGLLLIYLLPLLVKVYIIVDFKIHQKQIAKELCVEKDIPESSCKGKCQLEKKLKETEEKESRNWPESISHKTEQHFVPLSVQLLHQHNAFINLSFPILFNEHLCCSGFLQDIFKPPKI